MANTGATQACRTSTWLLSGGVLLPRTCLAGSLYFHLPACTALRRADGWRTPMPSLRLRQQVQFPRQAAFL